MSTVKEIYECDGMTPNVKYVLTIYEGGNTDLVFYNGAFKTSEPNVRICEIGTNGGKRIEYGTPNVKSSLPFMRYSDGKLDDKWTRIK